MPVQQKIFKIIHHGLNLIDQKNDWRFFNEFVLCEDYSKGEHQGQRKFLEGSVQRENAIHPGNGWGKTSVIAKKHIKFVLKHFADGIKYKTLNAAITQDQSELMQDEIESICDGSPVLRGWFIKKVVKHPQARIIYSNGARSEFKTTKKKGESIEGKEYGYISIDEIALEAHLEFIRDKIILPRLRAWQDSQSDYAATPKGYTAWYRVLQDIKRCGGYIQGGSAFENPFIDHGLLEYQIRGKPKEYVQQVIEGKFIDTSSMMFASRVLKLFNDDLDFTDVIKGHKYVEGWDLARGRKKGADLTVGFRIDITHRPFTICKLWAFQLPWTEKERELINAETGVEVEKSSIEREIRNANKESKSRVFIDSTGVGDTLYSMVRDIAKPVDFRGGNKDKLLDHCQAVIDSGILQSPFNQELADQMTLYQLPDTNLDTDYLMALVVACSALPVLRPRVIKTNHARIFCR